jgi:hypothetical protein
MYVFLHIFTEKNFSNYFQFILYCAWLMEPITDADFN